MTQFDDLLAHLDDQARCSQCLTGQIPCDPADTPVRVFRERDRSQARPTVAEASRLRESLGGELRALRAEAGLSQWRLSVRAGTARSTVEDLEAGRRRPTPSMLASLVLAATHTTAPAPPPTHQARVSWLLRLAEAAGVALVADTPAGVRRRARRLAEAERRWRWLLASDARQAAEVQAAQRRAFTAGVRVLAKAQSVDAIIRAAERIGW